MKSIFTKVAIIVFAISIMCVETSAQEKGKFRVGLDLGLNMATGGPSLGMNIINLGYNIQDNMNVGIKWGYAMLAKEEDFFDVIDVYEQKYLGTFNYYFLNSKIPLFVGGGLGVSRLKKHHDDVHISIDEGSSFCGLLTAGLEYRKFRLAVEYNMIPRSDYTEVVFPQNPDQPETIISGKMRNSSIAITVGFFLGGGKWKKRTLD
ncbi:hypothetical protein M2137_000423 [Parabacteroides sp. PFB2-10]|uniref:outer membrane beta-barrel protein n=1 Tax=Parabacteroides sp. PFB2-10 TaxID=1742405 RepID=UPI002476EE4E|nr:outer membrane beta-barrel protein [Parabacteroides sp. PFB2-10]MDH6311664.1 hypothetical protein [Parabacteroides sp. PFB2-10]